MYVHNLFVKFKYVLMKAYKTTDCGNKTSGRMTVLNFVSTKAIEDPITFNLRK